MLHSWAARCVHLPQVSCHIDFCHPHLRESSKQRPMAATCHSLPISMLHCNSNFKQTNKSSKKCNTCSPIQESIHVLLRSYGLRLMLLSHVPDPKYTFVLCCSLLIQAPDKKARKKKDPNAPKRNMTSYMHYSNAMRAQVTLPIDSKQKHLRLNGLQKKHAQSKQAVAFQMRAQKL